MTAWRWERRVIGGLLVVAGVTDMVTATNAATGKFSYPLWAQVGNSFVLGVLLVSLGVGYARRGG
jgi:hypothetical protein